MPINGTQAGDVYSYAIIVQEILFRTEPFPGGPCPKGEYILLDHPILQESSSLDDATNNSCEKMYFTMLMTFTCIHYVHTNVYYYTFNIMVH